MLDSSFGGSGIIHGAHGSGGEVGGAVLTDSSDRILLLGGTRDASNNQAPIARRFKQNGTPDTCFGNGGHIVFDAYNKADPAGAKSGVDEAMLYSNKIIAAGSRANGSNVDMAIYRLK